MHMRVVLSRFYVFLVPVWVNFPGLLSSSEVGLSYLQENITSLKMVSSISSQRMEFLGGTRFILKGSSVYPSFCTLLSTHYPAKFHLIKSVSLWNSQMGLGSFLKAVQFTLLFVLLLSTHYPAKFHLIKSVSLSTWPSTLVSIQTGGSLTFNLVLGTEKWGSKVTM